jgi:hypothetical protein
VIHPAIASSGSPVTALIAINDGRLIQYFNERLFEFGDVASNFVRQLRGECGERQVANAKLALAHGTGGILSTNATVILGVS